MKLNKKYFENKTWEEILSEIDFKKYLKNLSKKLKGRPVVLYGAGTMLDYMMENYDFSGLNVKAVCDKKYEGKSEQYKNYLTITPSELKDDVIIICTQYPYGIYKFLKREIYKSKKLPKIYFMLNKPFKLYFEEIFQG